MAKLEKVEGIEDKYAGALRKAGVRSTDDLLKKGSTYMGRKKLAQAAGVSDKLILVWINHVDLFRIKGVGEEYADLLEEAGVDTVVELAQRNPENLYQKILEVNLSKKLVRQLPTSAQVADWIVQAKKLPRVINY
jgi:predicted flap endonuclease-1-like 5' DNA nuclease